VADPRETSRRLNARQLAWAALALLMVPLFGLLLVVLVNITI
jgi:hypothetical protein